ncbi:hypothetical protein OAK09_02390 [Candidatus Marinimicrobia bacterium]|nr:hypothetical protein [Candidatus Neomarinimicrobiota bacterium]
MKQSNIFSTGENYTWFYINQDSRRNKYFFGDIMVLSIDDVL